MLLPINTLRMLHRLNAVWLTIKYFFLDLFIVTKFHCFWTTLLMFGQKWLLFNVSGTHICFGFSLTLSFNISFRSNFSTVDMCLSRRSDLYPFSINFCLSLNYFYNNFSYCLGFLFPTSYTCKYYISTNGCEMSIYHRNS